MEPAIRSRVYCRLAHVYWAGSETWCQVLVMCCSGNLFENFSGSEKGPVRILKFQKWKGVRTPCVPPHTHVQAHTPSSDALVELYCFSLQRNICAEDGSFWDFSESKCPDLPFARRNYSSIFILSHDTHFNPSDDLFDVTISPIKPTLPSLFHKEIVW